ncbi:MAG: hypothetical protein WBN65_06645, partial [Gammaproteobacteria bacterium]
MSGSNPHENDAGSPLRNIATSPAWFLRDLDPIADKAVLSPMDEASYRASVFLDHRIRRAAGRDLAVDLDALLELAARAGMARRPVHYLFHVGHCGSTLLSRLLGECRGLMALREPPVLMGLSRSLRRLQQPGFPIRPDRWEALLELCLRCLGRTWRTGQTALVKPTSHAGNLIPRLLTFTGEEHALMLYVGLETFLTTMLRPEIRRETVLFARDFRIADFNLLIPDSPVSTDDFGPGPLAAMSWLLHTREMAAALDDPSLGGRIKTLDFDHFLASPETTLSEVCDFLGQHPGPDTLSDLLARHLGHSAKDPEQPFDAGRRQQELTAARKTHAADIETGLAWAERIDQD